MKTVINSADLHTRHFKKISQTIYQICGIKLLPGKEEMVKARLMKRLRVLGLTGFQQYLDFVEQDKSGAELSRMVDLLTTNKTDFFRELPHFDYLRKDVLPALSLQKKTRWWSAGCSSGEEPYSIAIQLRENLPGNSISNIKILATDISSRMVHKAREAIYEYQKLQDVSPYLIRKYFNCIQSAAPPVYQAKQKIRDMVQVARLNLMQAWPMKGPFTIIFCRNVMIYFDKPTQEKLINRFWDLLEYGGYLFVGHSESMAGISHKFQYIQPAIFRK